MNDFITAISLVRSGVHLDDDQIEWLPSVVDESRETLLHYFSIEKECEIVLKLINLGFDFNAADEFGYTPLTSAGLLDNSKDVVETLLSAGADPFIKDACDLSLLDNLQLLGRSDEAVWIVDVYNKFKQKI